MLSMDINQSANKKVVAKGHDFFQTTKLQVDF